jgi:hypothetical protein
MAMWIKNTLKTQRKLLSGYLEPALYALAEECRPYWNDPAALNAHLRQHFERVPYCGLLYAVDKNGRQISANISAQRIDPGPCGQDLSNRPYADSLYPKRHFALSGIYLSHYSGRNCITGMQPVYDDQQFLGFIMADFDPRDLPIPLSVPDPAPRWRQAREWPGEKSPLGERPAELSRRMGELFGERGVFQATLDYDNGLALLWHLDDPYQYRLHSLQELLDPALCLIYPLTAWPARATLKPAQIGPLWQTCAALREAGEALSAVSLNTVNGMLGLTFSNESSHYLSAAEFLLRETALPFGAPPWHGSAGRGAACYM